MANLRNRDVDMDTAMLPERRNLKHQHTGYIFPVHWRYILGTLMFGLSVWSLRIHDQQINMA
jgi:hypothetical protein